MSDNVFHLAKLCVAGWTRLELATSRYGVPSALPLSYLPFTHERTNLVGVSDDARIVFILLGTRLADRRLACYVCRSANRARPRPWTRLRDWFYVAHPRYGMHEIHLAGRRPDPVRRNPSDLERRDIRSLGILRTDWSHWSSLNSITSSMKPTNPQFRYYA